MALRIPWDVYETAILIDACVRVQNNEIDRWDAVTEVSTLLRRRAVNLGINIDDIYRNTNGISMQMISINGLLDENAYKLRNASKVFRDAVDMYNMYPSKFEEILTKAKNECNIR